jgi:GGDEF domain-containing protein
MQPVEPVRVENDDTVHVLAGDLSEKPIAWLLMAAQHYEATGRMQIGLPACSVSLQFGVGQAVHAQSPLYLGTEAILDLFIWKHGKVKFESGKQPDSVTVQETVEELIRKGEAYANGLQFLQEHGISDLSFLRRPAVRHAIGEVEQRLKKGLQFNINTQMDFYSNIYGTRNIKDTAGKLSLPPSQWVSITANLLQLGILLTPEGKSLQTIQDNSSDEPKHSAEFQALRLPESEQKLQTPQPLTNLWHTKATVHQGRIDPAQEVTITPASMAKRGVSNHIVTLDPADHNSVLMMLSSDETGIFTFEAFQFFLAREFARACRFKTIMTLVLFSIRCDSDGENQKVSPEVRTLVTTTVSLIKRDVDIFGHFGTQAFALLLPNVDSNQACLLVDRINHDLLEITPDLKTFNVSLHFGLASIPQDSSEINGLVKAAQVAMFHATTNELLQTQASQLRS